MTSAHGQSRTTATGTRALLDLRRVQASYGPYKALFDVSFTVPEGSTVAVVGSNGAGKSSVVRVISGLVRPGGGTIRFEGREITGWPAWRIARAGIAHATEGRPVFSTLTVEENLLLAARSLPGPPPTQVLDRAFSAFPHLGERRHQLAGTLSGGEQRLLSIARVLAVPPRLLMVDELSLGLSPTAIDDVFEALRSVRALGTSLLVVEQHLDRVLAIADRVVLLARGRVLAEGAVADVKPALADLLPSHPGAFGAGTAGPACR